MIEEISDKLRVRAQEALIGLPAEEISQWKAHPITTWLIRTLEADSLDIAWTLQHGEFTVGSIEGTALQHAKAVGQSEEIELILDAIKSLTVVEEEESDYTDGP